MSREARTRWAAVAGLLVLGGVLTVLGGAPIVNNSLSVWFVEDDPARLAYESFQSLFENDEVLVLSVGSPGAPLTRALLDRVGVVADRMREVDGIAAVTGPEDVGPLAELLTNDDGSVALLVARFDVMDDADARRHDILVDLRGATTDLEGEGIELHWAGIGLVYDELNEVSFRETPVLTGASFLVVGVVLYLVVGSVPGVLIGLASVVAAILILMGTFTLAGYELNMVTAILPTLLLVVGTANAVHIFTRLRRAKAESLDQALRDVFKPCLFTALTTAAGFASLTTARMAVIRDLGLFAALGVLISLVTSFVFVNAAISGGWLRLGPVRVAPIQAVLKVISGVAVARPWRVLAGSVAVTLVALWAASHLIVDTYSIEFFREGHPVRVDSDAIEAGYGWYLPLEFAVRTEDGGALEPELLQDVSDWQSEVEAAGLAQWSLSIVSFEGAVGDVPGSDTGSTPTISADPVAVGLVDADYSALRVTYGVPMASARGWKDRIESIRESAEAHLPAATELESGGYLPLYVRMMEYVVDTQIRSFAWALILVFSLMAVFLRSPRVVLVAVFPNLLPIIFVFGLMGLLGIRLDIATVTVAAIALGIVVDDTVHLLHRFREGLDRSGDPAEAVRDALHDVGPALVGTTVILASSFAILGFATVLSIAHFGLLAASTLVLAMISDLVVLPALLVVSVRSRALPAKNLEGAS